MLLGTGLLGCMPGAAEQKEEVRPDFFFDVKGYFEAEIARLNTSQPTVKKIASIGDLKEEQQLKSLDYTQELQLFASADINKLAWEEKYSTKEKTSLDGAKITTHQALDSSLKIKQIEVATLEEQVQSITILKSQKNALAGTDQKLVYQPARGFSVENEQELILGDGKKIKVEILFIND